MKKLGILIGTFAFLSLISAPIWARNSGDIKDYDRLRLLQQATGGGSSPAGNSSFETRVNTLLNVGSQATPTFDTQAREEYAVNAQIKEKARLEASETQKILEKNQRNELGYQPKDNNLSGSNNLALESKVPANKDDFTEKSSLVDASEDNFQKNLQKQNEKNNEAEVPAKVLESKKEKNDKSGMLPSLKNNPFYFAGNSAQTKEEDTFEISKPLLLTRMVQGGLSVDEAEEILATSSSAEDVILRLMQDFGRPYNVAKDIATTKRS